MARVADRGYGHDIHRDQAGARSIHFHRVRLTDTGRVRNRKVYEIDDREVPSADPARLTVFGAPGSPRRPPASGGCGRGRAVRQQWSDLDVEGRAVADFLLVRLPSEWSYGKASWEINLG
ncbi:hypothetical protein [Streptomyces sp. NPDC127038]|uniref:hypothetical protein n=1 Tax=Streptomyces sp. NPDC127038 TaxID=3347114 RepID=UPI0036536B5A